MPWKKLLSYIAGSVDQELLHRNEYLVTENRVLRNQIKGQVRLSDLELEFSAVRNPELLARACPKTLVFLKPNKPG